MPSRHRYRVPSELRMLGCISGWFGVALLHMLFGSTRTLAVCLLAACLAGAAPVCALEPHTPLARFGRQSWSIENGLPQSTVPVLLQTNSGYLLAGTESGLARFDGAGFRIFDHASSAAFPDAEIRCLLDTGGSGLGEDDVWAGTADGLARIRGMKVTRFTTRDGLPANLIRGLARTTDGVLWVWTESGLARWTGSRFEVVPLRRALQGSEITSMAPDGRNGLWIGSARGVALFLNGRWATGPEAHLRGSGDGPALVEAASGDILISAANGVFRVHDGSWTTVLMAAALPPERIIHLARLSGGAIAIASESTLVLAQWTASGGRVIGRYLVSKQLPGTRIGTIFADREGCLWIGTNRGLARITVQQARATVERLPATDPLGGAEILSILEDREGDLWAGTETSGLHILRDARFRMLGAAEGLSSDNTTAVVEDTGKAVWIGTRDAGLNRVSASQTTTLTTANGLLSNVILSLAAAADGAVWAGTPDGLNRIGPAIVTTYTSADGLPDDFIRSLQAVPDGSLWIGTRRGLTHFEDGRFRNWTHADGLGSDLVGALARTPDGDLWIATPEGLSRLHQGRFHNYRTADGLSSNVITALEAGPDGTLWVGTQSDGLNFWDGHRFTALSAAAFPAARALPKAIHALLRDERGWLWIASDTGVTRVATQALLECARLRPCSLDGQQLATFSAADGLRSRETSSTGHPTACRTDTGELWFTSPRGVMIANSLHFPANPMAPPVVIERFAVDDREQDPARMTRIEAGHLRVQFDYAGLSFAAPHKVRYQYMLEGFDRGWTDAGTRRTAYYTNIPPGSYRFRVRATMDGTDFAEALGTASEGGPAGASDGTAGASLAFTLLPHYYQTMWFRVLVACTAAALVLLFVRRRVLRVEREFGAVMAERSRIAREIHDTLAQGYVGISLQLEILGELLRHNRTDAAAKHLAMTQKLVRDGLDDARQSIWALRSQDAAETTLPIRLRRLVEEAPDPHLDATLAVHGAYRALPAATEQEMLRIAQEAIQNVKHHAGASRLQARLDYDAEAVALTVSDNGKGFEVDRGPQAGGPFRAAKAGSGHFGLIGMQERAALLRGRLEVTSQPGHGTTIKLEIDAQTGSAGTGSLDKSAADRNGLKGNRPVRDTFADPQPPAMAATHDTTREKISKERP